MTSSQTHVVRIDVDTVVSDLEGDAVPEWAAFLGRHPGLDVDGARLRRIRSLAGKAACGMKTSPVSTITIVRSEWPSLADYAAAISGDDDAHFVCERIEDRTVRTTDALLVEAALRANARAEARLFDVRSFPAVMARYARLELPSALSPIADALRPGTPRAIWGDPFVHCPGHDAGVHHLFIPGAAQNVRDRLSRRITAIGVLHDLHVVVGDRAWSGTASAVALAELVRRFLIHYGSRIDDRAEVVGREDGDPVALRTVAEDYVAFARSGGFDHHISAEDVDVVVDGYGGNVAARAVGAACADEAVRASVRSAPAY